MDHAAQAGRAAGVRAVPALPQDPAAAALWLAALARPAEPRRADVTPVPPREEVAIVDGILAGGDPKKAQPLGLEAQRLDHGIVLLRERFEAPEDRLGEASVMAAASLTSVPVRAVGLVPRPGQAPVLAALAARLLEDGALDAIVIAGVDEIDARGRSADAAGRGLARALAYRGGGGMVLELRAAGGTAASG